MQHPFRLSIIFYWCTFIFLSIPAFAEQNIDIFNLPLSELINVKILSEVASMYPEEDLVVGSSVSVITSDNIRQKGCRRLKDALENELSVTQNINLGGAYTTSIRGYTKKTASGTAMLIDGISISSAVHSAPNFHVPDWMPGTLNRIEMIKGPGSAIYGSEAFHGVIALSTFESDKNYYHAEGALSDTAYEDGSFKLSHGFNNNRLRINISGGMSFQGDEHLKYTYNDRTDIPSLDISPESGTGVRRHEYETQTGVFKLNFNPTDRLKTKISYYCNRYDSEKFPGAHYSSSGLNLRDYDFSAHDASMDIISGSVSYLLKSGITLLTDAYYWENVLKGEYSLYGYPIPAKNIFETIDAIAYDKNTRASASLTIKQSENANHLAWLIACSFTEVKIPGTNLIAQTSESKLEITNSKMPYDNFSRQIKSIYGQIKWTFIQNKAYFLAGGRLDSYNDVGDQFMPRLGIIFQPTENSSVKALYGKAFNAPSAYNIHGSIVTFMGSEDIKPETINVYELIYLYQNNNWKLNLTGFHSHWQNGIILAPFSDPNYPDHNAIYENRGKNRAYGIETSLFLKIDHIAFDFGFSYVTSKDLNREDPYHPGNIIDLEYEAFPEYSVLFGLYYTLMPFKIDLHLNNRIYLERKEYSISETPTTAGLPEKLDTYFRTDLTLSKSLKNRYKIDLSIRNLFDRNNYIPSNFGADNGVLEPGISGLLRMSYTF